MDLTRENLDSLFTGFNTSLNEGLAQADLTWEQWCLVINSKAPIEKYPAMFLTGGMREWIGPRVIHDLDGKLMQVRNRPFEGTVKVNRDNIADDSLGIYSPVFKAMGINANNLWPQIATESAVDATTTWLDDKTFFLSTSSGSGARQLGDSGVIVNKTTNALSAANYLTARALMMGFHGSDGQPLGLVPSHLMYGPALESTFDSIFSVATVSDGGVTPVSVGNPHYKKVVGILNPRFVGDYANYWHLMCLTRGFKPFAVQKRLVGPLVAWDTDHDQCVKDDNENHYGLHYRGAAVGLVPHLVIGNMAT